MRISMKSALLAGAVCVSLAGHAVADGPQVYDGYKVPHDSLGRPVLNGVWDAATITSFQRLPGYGDRLVMTPAEVAKAEGTVAAINAQAAKKTDQSLTVGQLPQDGSGNYNAGFLDPGTTVMRVHGEPRTSLLTTPDGLIPVDLKGHKGPPPRQIGGEEGATPLTVAVDDPTRNDNPETRSLSERCVLGFTNGVVIAPSLYDSITSITQSRDTVAIQSEVIHAVRVVHLNAKHRTDGVREWDGDSIGHYEGNTLVVETIGFDPRFPKYGASDDVKVTERFTRVSPTRLYYAFTIEDPKTWAKPWGGEYELKAAQGIYEYACTEGNYGQEAILAGARYAEAQAREKAATASNSK
jgi:hypothetical protein